MYFLLKVKGNNVSTYLDKSTVLHIIRDMAHNKFSKELGKEVTFDFPNPPRAVEVRWNPDRVRTKCTIDGRVLTKGEFAALIGMSSNTYIDVSNNNTSQIRKDTLEKLLSVGCTLNDLIEVV